MPDELEASRSSRKRAWENLQELRRVLQDSAGMKLPPPAKKTIDPEGTLIKDGVRWRGVFQTQIDELKGTNRNTTPTREKILARIESELNMVFQYLDDLKDGLWMHSGKGVSTSKGGGSD